MKSGLEGRNNSATWQTGSTPSGCCLNEVRPRRPEQFYTVGNDSGGEISVSMKSGLEGRNNFASTLMSMTSWPCLNEVRPRRPEQLWYIKDRGIQGRVVSMKSGLEGRNNCQQYECWAGVGHVSMKSGLEGHSRTLLAAGGWAGLNEVRPRRPEQFSRYTTTSPVI